MRISDWSSDVGYSDLLYSSGIDWLPVFIEHRPDCWTAASAICARRESRSHGLNAGQLLVGNGLQDGPGPNVEAYAKDGPSILSRLGGSTSERSEEHTSELQSLMRISYAVCCLKKKNKKATKTHTINK